MAQYTSGQVGTETLRAGNVLTVTVLAGSGATVRRYLGSTEYAEPSVSTTTSFGPYEVDQSFKVCPFAGSTVDIAVSSSPGSTLNDAQALAAQALVARDGNMGRGPTMGTRIAAGPLLVVTVGGNPTFFDATHQLTARLARGAYAVRLIFAGYAATATVSLKASVSAGTDPAANNSAGSWTAVTFGGGSATGTIPARQSATRPSLYLSDWVGLDVSSKILHVRAYIPSAGNTEATVADFSQNSTDTTGRNAWATLTGDEWVNRRQSVDAVGTASLFTSTATQGFNLVYGIQYMTRDGVITVAGCGDSIMSGTYSTLAYDPHWVRAARALKLSGAGIETANLGWQGQTTTVYQLRALDAISTLGLQHMIYSPWSPNDGVNDPTWVHYDGMRSRWEAVIAAGITGRCQITPITGIPKTTGGSAVSAWTQAEDDIRRYLNAEIRNFPRYLDPDAIVADRTSPGTTAAGFADASYVETSGYIHLTEAGNEACKASIQSVLAGLLYA